MLIFSRYKPPTPFNSLAKVATPQSFFNASETTETDQRVYNELLSIADRARDSGRWLVASEIYEQALRKGGPTVSLLLQTGHMHKEARNFSAAEERYLQAEALDSENAEVLLQLGHFYKTVGRWVETARYYRLCALAAPDWIEPRRELQSLREAAELRLEAERDDLETERRLLARGQEVVAPTLHPLVDPELFSKTSAELCIEHQEAWVFRRNGRFQVTPWGRGPTLRGVEALRGYLVSDAPYLKLEIYLDGDLIHKGDFTIAPQRFEKKNSNIQKYAYNVWIDFTDMPRGRHDLVFRAVSVRGEMREGVDWRRLRVIVADPLDPTLFEASDGLVPRCDPQSPLTVAEQINARPSAVHPCSPHSLPFMPQHIAVLRPDQLGDLVVSTPALLRLRQLFPNTKITGLLSRANEGLGRTLGVFDDIVILDFPDDPIQRRRVMEREGQEALIRQLAPYKFDFVIDLPVSGESFRLLPLTGAPLTIGFGGGPKSIELSVSSHDPITSVEFMKHSARTRMLVEALALFLDSGARVIRRDDLRRASLTPYGLGESVDYVVLHTGSRIKFTQWPHYTELARRIVEDLGKTVVFMAESEDPRALLPAKALADGSILFVSGQMPFDVFDAFLSFASAFVGNDSGPKHLASLRGVPTISIHSARIGWSEWAQELTGVAISRRVPCAGCSLHHDPEECAKDYACIKLIKVDEVFSELKKLLVATPLRLAV